jgi:ElaB/YqjD/DUF883 family membrane-anchored ribosome-binding protein
LTEPDDKITAELAALRAEIESLKAMRGQADRAAPESQGDASTIVPGAAAEAIAELTGDNLVEVENAIREMAEAIEDEIAERPVVAVSTAFLLGFLFGRLSKHS